MDDEELTERLARIEAKLDWIAARVSEPPAAPTMVNGLTADEQRALSGGNIIQAISLYRSRTGVSLKEAKHAIDAARG